MTAGASLSRIVQLVAELSRDPDAAERGVPLAELAARLGTTPEQIQRDIRTLTSISDDAETEWLQSLSAWQEADRVTAVSHGPYRRPIRFTPDELLAIRVGLALEGAEGEQLASRLAAQLGAADVAGEPPVAVAGPGEGEAQVVALAREAIESRRMLRLLYAGERDSRGVERQVEPHQVISACGRWYVLAWCRHAQDWRHFRADRVIDIMLEAETFTPRDGYGAGGDAVFRAAEVPDEVRVRFSPAVARWLAERIPTASRGSDGSLEVTYRVVEPAWLVRTVLQYADEAEVIGPPEYRRVMARALARSVRD